MAFSKFEKTLYFLKRSRSGPRHQIRHKGPTYIGVYRGLGAVYRGLIIGVYL